MVFFSVFFFCKFFRDLNGVTDMMAVEGICELKNTYWLYVIGYWLYTGPITPKKTSHNQLSIKQLKLRLCGCLMRG